MTKALTVGIIGIIVVVGVVLGNFILSQKTKTAIPTSPSPKPGTETTKPLYIESLRAFSQKGQVGEVEIVSTLRETPTFTSFSIAYPSQGLRITGFMNVPKGDGLFPAIILNHGYFIPSRYSTGDGTRKEAEYLAQRGYVTVASDYRGYGGSDKGDSLFRVGYVYDVLSLIPAVQRLSFVDPNRIGMWGHSMGGMITIKAFVANPSIKAAVLVAPVSADEADAYRLVKESTHENVATASDLAWLEQNYGTPESNPDVYAKMSAINSLKDVTTPIIIHHSEGDQHVPFSWSEKLRDALKKENKEVELYRYSGQLHTFSAARDLSQWDQIMERTLALFGKYLK